MSMADRSWSANVASLWRLGRLGLALLCLLWPSLLAGQATDAIAQANQQKARATLAATIQALGGQAWLDLRTSRSQVRVASFFQGTPTGNVAEATITRQLPDKERIDLEKGRVVQIFSGTGGWEITYKGRKELPAERLDDYLRWRKYSLRTVLGDWYRNPATVLMDQGQSQVERHLAEKITLMNAANEAVTLEVDTDSHLPLRLSFTWRDPHFHDKNLDAVEYDNYQRIDNIATPFTVTRTHNSEIVRQSYLLGVEYNVALKDGLFDPDRAAAHFK